MSRRVRWLMVGLLACFGWLCWDAARREAPTYDEPLHLVSGYSFWASSHYWIDVYHPPLARMILSAPLLLFPLELHQDHPTWQKRQRYEFSDFFFYHNTLPFDRLLLSGRAMAILIGLGLGLLIGFWSFKEWGPAATVAATLAYAFCPVIIGNAHIISNDVAVSFFYLLTFYLFRRFLRQPSDRRAAACGLALGAAIATKFSGLMLLPMLAAILVVHWRKRRPPARQVIRWISVAIGTAGLCVLLVYCIHEVPTFFRGILMFQDAARDGRNSFFLGDYREHGWLAYFAVAFLIKTPLPFIIALVVGGWALLKSPHRTFLLTWVYFPSAFYLVLVSISPTQIGLRHLLPIYPLLCLAIGESVARTWQQRQFRLLWGVLGVTYMAEAAYTHPYELAYFNQLVGGSAQGYRYLVDANLDWGQELKTLGEYLREQQVDTIYLSYFGTADPHVYGIRYHAFYPVTNVSRPSDEDRDLQAQPRVLLAISATNLQGVYFADHQLFAWLKKRTPVKILGHSLFVYDLTGDAEAHLHLADLYHKAGMPTRARAEIRWASQINKSTR